jgi:hypothetical protein
MTHRYLTLRLLAVLREPAHESSQGVSHDAARGRRPGPKTGTRHRRRPRGERAGSRSAQLRPAQRPNSGNPDTGEREKVEP